ncbi:MAG: hypothetical protein OFPII_35270 [Osedax symbiont Rs1]|nr:MAG: hypothetical protein OFPII_35270 [Osedax symbiont Rs1]
MLSALAQSKFDSYPPHVQQVLLSARQLILQVAKEQNISSVEESLKWGQLSYSAKHASTIRIDWSDKTPQQFYFYFICSTCLVDTFKELYPNNFAYQGNRAIALELHEKIATPALQHCLAMSLNYHKIKHLTLLGN